MQYLNALLGGMGLFLLGMWLMTDGLKLAAGDALRSILHNWTKTPSRGLVTGFAITALVQSSSAITVATIGFANAGLINLQQAIWVIFGSNVGTTMTGWIVAMIGFKINLEAYALPLIGIGMLVKMTGGKGRRMAIGQAILGFGLFFLGISVLKEAFMGLGTGMQLPSVVEGGVKILILYVLIGLILTTLMQSSSAAIVVTLSAAESGLIPLGAAAATVIGANLGTTTTSLLSVIGATPTAKRVAVSHILFNLITAITALILMSPMLWMVEQIETMLDAEPDIATTLALYHTVFNVLGVLLMWPLAKRLTRFLQKRFVSREELLGKPRYLDSTVLSIPAVAVDALFKELMNIKQYVVQAGTAMLSREDFDAASVEKDHTILINLTSEISSYITRLNKQDLPNEIAVALPEMMLVTQKCVSFMELAKDAVDLQGKIHFKQEVPETQEAITRLKKLAVKTLDNTLLEERKIQEIDFDQALLEIDNAYEDLKMQVFKQGTRGELGIVSVDAIIHQASLFKRMIKLAVKVTRHMQELHESLAIEREDDAPEEDVASAAP